SRPCQQGFLVLSLKASRAYESWGERAGWESSLEPEHLPQASALFTGRHSELSRLEHALKRVPVTLVYGLAGMGKSALALVLAGRWPPLVLYNKAAARPVEALLARAYRQLSGKDVAAKTNVDDLILKVAARLDEHRGLWITDGLHQMPASAAKN